MRVLLTDGGWRLVDSGKHPQQLWSVHMQHNCDLSTEGWLWCGPNKPHGAEKQCGRCSQKAPAGMVAALWFILVGHES